MDKYLAQLLADIAYSTANVSSPHPTGEQSDNIWDWISDEEEDKTAPRRLLEDWTGIRKAQLPPDEQLTDEQVQLLFEALKKMLDAYNWMFVLQIQVPERIQYRALRDNFDQEAICKRWHMGFFELCKKGTPHGECALGEEYCHCAFFAEMFSHFVDEELTPEEERRRHLEIEIRHLKRKYDDDWMKYYPYHLDPNYDDENGNPYDYGFGEDFDEEADEDDWWRK
ncbi:MAG: hypothetical protein IPN76_12415 [Saprospiraceae bacterium]|nr:hypothetical protein [Saprospiraceae bacterium]